MNGRTRVLLEVDEECQRQRALQEAGRFKFTPADTSLAIGFTMLSEEVGEVARALLATDGLVQEPLTIDDVRTELVQVAAIAVAMIEGIDNTVAP